MFVIGEFVFIKSRRLRGHVRTIIHGISARGKVPPEYAVEVTGGDGVQRRFAKCPEHDLEPVRVLRLVVDNAPTIPEPPRRARPTPSDDPPDRPRAA